jgi:transposase
LKFFAELAPCTVGIEACGRAPYWARELSALGHNVRLMPPGYVKPYVKRGKNDAADAEAICEAVMRPTMHLVAVKSAEQQANAMIYKDALRSHLSEMGIVAAQGVGKLDRLITVLHDPNDGRLPPSAKLALQELAKQIEVLDVRIDALQDEIISQVRSSGTARRLATVPGIGPIIAGSMLAMVPDPAGFRSARHFAAWLAFTPRQNSSAGKPRLGSISKQGNRYLRSLLVLGPANVLPQQGVHIGLAHRLARASAFQGRRRGSRPQDGPHRPGADGQGWNLSRGQPGRSSRLIGGLPPTGTRCTTTR